MSLRAFRGRLSLKSLLLIIILTWLSLLYFVYDEVPLPDAFVRKHYTWPVDTAGLVTVPTKDGNVVAPHHPIHDFIASAEVKWNAMLKRQSKTFEDAVLEYKRRYGRMPPKGFDAWYKFATENDFILIDEFDQIDHDITPYLATPPAFLEKRVKALDDLPVSLHIVIKSGKVTWHGPTVKDRRSTEVGQFIKEFSRFLPDMIVHMSGHDAGSQIFGEDFRAEVKEVLRLGRTLTPGQIEHFENLKRNPRKGFTNACNDDSPSVLNDTVPPIAERPTTFIGEHRKGMNFCQNPNLRHGHGGFWYDGAHGAKISPYFVMCKLDQGGELLMPALSGYGDLDMSKNIPWAQRAKDSRLFWRGRTTGNHFSRHHRDWRGSHRISLHNITNSRTSDPVQVLLERKAGILVKEAYPRKKLNERYMDVGLVGKPTQCGNDGTCEEMEKEISFLPVVAGQAGMNSKYVLDVDGNGWSQRFRRLLGSGALVFKSTAFPEWNTDRMVPWYHYVPLQHDYADLYDLMAFFAGKPDDVLGTPEHDAMAEAIASHSAEYVEKHWRWEDLQVYMFRLLLEYARAISQDREAMSMKMEDVGLR